MQFKTLSGKTIKVKQAKAKYALKTIRLIASLGIKAGDEAMEGISTLSDEKIDEFFEKSIKIIAKHTNSSEAEFVVDGELDLDFNQTVEILSFIANGEQKEKEGLTKS